MSSKRGRKRNDNLPPNRARDVQRAFRARRAAHLEALENRVTELEEENNQLRAALNLPPANRPPLGKGPTGKDKPKPKPSSSSAEPSPNPLLPSIPALTSSGTLPPLSRTESPLSTGSISSAHSMSPDPALGPAASMPQASAPSLDPASWADTLYGDKDSNQPLPSSSFSLPPPPNQGSPFGALGRSTTSDLFNPVPDKFQGFPNPDEKSFGFLPPDERRTFSYPPTVLDAAQASMSPSLQARVGAGRSDATNPNGPRVPGSITSLIDGHLPPDFDLAWYTERRYPRLH
ncbi:hypothetical protein C8Q79DRAFT_1007865 [Trametes meyenii]|nr:hypothetical protein C8Q79DRAFT_1007865 [Trametes meyenii]